jgi:hypothetical protein
MALDAQEMAGPSGPAEVGEPSLGGRDGGSRDRWQYYRHPDGSVVLGPAWLIEAAKLIENGFTPLRAYGTFWLTTNKNEPGGPWRPSLPSPGNKFRRLFRMGGAKEFPAWQVVDGGWHVNPPFPGVTFPQLEGVEILNAECPSCHRQFYSVAGRQPSAQEKLGKHEQIAHREAARNTQLSRAIAGAISDRAEATETPLGEALAAILQQNQLLAQQMQQQQAILVELLQERTGRSKGLPNNKAD